ncbi:ABC transporter substrate-binding protein [Thioalkalivibrio sp. HK1]|uniref:ABC transporter substrate-binding protein n=1 Tax=Thioalkalivibrio sp. HK1 TaxID=1469245 RepID=UPI000471965B|nr:ABC transporter substrate-binding protein [Thioalkalivibrio sp. HK1]
MRPATLLIILPLVVTIILVQSLFWIPTQENQDRATPERLTRYIDGSTGDARVLNPILSSDVASGNIIDLVFDGLLEYDENLELRGVLAKDWELSEFASIAVLPDAFFPDGRAVDAKGIEDRVIASLERLPATSDLVRSVHIEPARVEVREIDLPQEEATATLTIRHPARVVFHLTRIDPDFFDRIEGVLGPGYARPPASGSDDPSSTFDEFIDVEPAHLRRQALASENAPAAEEFEILRHQPIIDFELRRGVRFHDGHEFDAGDVIFTFDAIVDSKNISPRASDFEPVESIERTGSHALRVIYKGLFSPAVSAWTIGILPEHILGRRSFVFGDSNADEPEEGGGERGRDDPMAGSERMPSEQDREGMRESPFNRSPIGTGAFRFVHWESDEEIHLVRNDDYHDGPAGFAHYHMRIIPDPLIQDMEFRTGALDTYSPQPHQVDRFLQDPAWQNFSYLGNVYVYIGWNMNKEIFQDPRVRRALGMAINIPEIIEHLIYGQGERTTGPYSKNTPWYDPDVPALPYDPDAAIALLQEVGYSKGEDGWLEKNGERLEFNLITNNGNEQRKALLSIAQNAWAKIGVKSNSQIIEWAVFLKDFINPRDFDAVILGWSTGIDYDLHQVWHSSQTEDGKLNFVGYKNLEVDAIIEDLRKTYDRQEQVRLAHALHRKVADDQPYTFLYASRSNIVLDRNIVMTENGETTGLRTTSMGRPFYYFNRWHKNGVNPELTP